MKNLQKQNLQTHCIHWQFDIYTKFLKFDSLQMPLQKIGHYNKNQHEIVNKIYRTKFNLSSPELDAKSNLFK
jgi:hypothetical protein